MPAMIVGHGVPPSAFTWLSVRWLADVFVVDAGARFETVARWLGFFPSASDAKRNGWSGPLVSGLRKIRGASHEFPSQRRPAGLLVVVGGVDTKEPLWR